MSNWKKFFKDHRDYVVNATYFECRSEFTMEEMYQAFKARMQQEDAKESHIEGCPARDGGSSCHC